MTECFSTDIPYTTPNNGFLDRGELGLQGSRPAEVIKLWLGLRFLGISGIEDILKSSINKKLFFEKNLNSSEFEIFSGPLHIISFIPKGMSTEESDKWTENKKIELMKNNFMLSRPRYKNKYFLRAVLGNYNTNLSHISELLNLINKIQ